MSAFKDLLKMGRVMRHKGDRGLEKVAFMIELNEVTKNFNSRKVLSGVDLKVKTGETLAVIGPSGCGKSTLLRLIIGLFRPDSGTILVGGEDVTRLDSEGMNDLREHLGMVFQSSALFDSLTVSENVAFGLREHLDLREKEIASIVSEKLELVGLSGIESHMPSELSGGMQKRVSLARAIATNPEIILYDEPTTGLDPITATSIENLMIDLHKILHITAVVVTHMMSTVYRVADRIVMLSEGRLIEAGTPEETKNSNNPTIRQFVTGGAGSQ